MWGTPSPKSIVILVNHHHDLHAALFLMKQADDAKGGKCRPISPGQRPLQLFPSVQAIRRPRCGAATRANSPVLLIIHACSFRYRKEDGTDDYMGQSMFEARMKPRGKRDGNQK